jgi:hypothetical protein
MERKPIFMSRRRLLQTTAGAGALAASATLWGSRAQTQAPTRKLTFAWNANAYCLTDLPPLTVPFITRKSGVARLIDLGGV